MLARARAATQIGRVSEARPRTGKTLSHPLLGSNMRVLVRLLRAYGPVDRQGRPVVAAALASAVARAPFTLLEEAWTCFSRGPEAGAEPPLFILGHWRSGTTHLYNILGQAPELGYVSPVATGLPWNFLVLGRLLRPFLEKALPSGRVIDNIPVTPTSPQEDEIALASMTELSFFHALYFPRHFRRIIERGLFLEGLEAGERQRWERVFLTFLGKARRAQPGRRMVIKNPVYTARAGRLSELLPGAAFIHVHRHPYEVFRSMRGYYQKLLPELALQADAVPELDEAILEIYTRMMRRLKADTASMPPERFIECAYTELDHDPIGLLERIYTQLDLPGFARHRHLFEAYLLSLGDYKKNPHSLSDAEKSLVRERADWVFEQWGYEG
jgi:hypothetical protein